MGVQSADPEDDDNKNSSSALQQQHPLSITHILGYFYLKVKYIFSRIQAL